MCVEQKNLGCMNGWRENPAAYVEHLEKCGTEYESKYFLGRPDKFEIRKFRKYPVVVTNLGRCYNSYSCEQCGCTWSVDSSD